MNNAKRMTVSIAITSFNRLKYLKALVASLEELASDPRFEINVVDNSSNEKGMVEFLKNSTIIDSYYINPRRNWINDEYFARNKLIEMSRGEFIWFIQDDSQFVATADQVLEYCQDLHDFPNGAAIMTVDAVRKITLQNRVYGNKCVNTTDTGNKYWVDSNNHLGTTGIYKRDLFRELGRYPTAWPVDAKYWGRSEDYYDAELKKKNLYETIAIRAHIPLVTSIWSDPRGGYAFIRGNKRYGHYLDPPHESGLYYEMLGELRIRQLMARDEPASFVDMSIPIGWKYAVDQFGDQMKYNQQHIMAEGPAVNIFEDEEIIIPEIVTKSDPEIEGWLNA